jgi:hypothetical protein
LLHSLPAICQPAARVESIRSSLWGVRDREHRHSTRRIETRAIMQTSEVSIAERKQLAWLATDKGLAVGLWIGKVAIFLQVVTGATG